MRSAGTMFGRLADEGGAAFFECVEHLREGELGVEAGDGFEFVERSAGVAEAASEIMGTQIPGTPSGVGFDEAGRGEDGRDEQGGFVADSAGGVLVDGEGVEGFGVEDLAGVTHGSGERGEFAGIEAALRKTAMRKAAIWASVTS